MPLGVPRTNQNQRHKWCGIIGVFIVKESPLPVKIYVRDSGRKACWRGQRCECVLFTSCSHGCQLISKLSDSLPEVIKTGDQGKRTATFSKLLVTLLTFGIMEIHNQRKHIKKDILMHKCYIVYL